MCLDAARTTETPRALDVTTQFSIEKVEKLQVSSPFATLEEWYHGNGIHSESWSSDWRLHLQISCTRLLLHSQIR